MRVKHCLGDPYDEPILMKNEPILQIKPQPPGNSSHFLLRAGK